MDYHDNFFDDFPIISAAKNELGNLSRTSFSSDGFSSNQIDAIARAIAAGIQAYEEQKKG